MAKPHRVTISQIFLPFCTHFFPTILQVAELYERTGYVYVRIGEYHRAHKPYMEALNLINQLNEE